jgi:signal transduction histidine kinase
MKKILVIDDEEWLREMVQMALRQRGYEVIEAGDGAVGIDRARKELPDLILCDVNMDKVDGYLTLSALREQPATASIPFILMTGLADNAGMRHGMELGADDYLPKPFTIDALYAAVDARLRKAQTVRQEAEKKFTELRDTISMALPHELRTPLNGILAYGEILTQESATIQAAEIAEMGQVIFESARRLERLIENFLILAQLEIIAADTSHVHTLRGKQTGDAAQVVGERARQQAAAASRAGDLKLTLVPVALPMSPEYLSKVVDELVQNAFKFSKAGSAVSVELADDSAVCSIIVSDQGPGLTAEQIRGFGAYAQFDRKRHEQQGLGMGLAIANRLTEMHGGKLSISPGAGVRVTVKIPKVVAT